MANHDIGTWLDSTSNEDIATFLDAPEPQTPVAPSAGLVNRLIESMMKDNAEIGNMYKRIIESGKEGFGPDPLGMSSEAAQWFRDQGVFNDTSKGQLSLLRTANEAIIRPAWWLGDLIFRATTGVISGIAEAGGEAAKNVQILQEKYGIPFQPVTSPETTKEKTKTELINFINYLLLDMGVKGGSFTRPEISATGKVFDARISALPYQEDFARSALVVASKDAAPIVEKLYNEKGILPSEVAYDAAIDKTITQDLSAGQWPRAYGPETSLALPEKTPFNRAKIEDIKQGGGTDQEFQAYSQIKAAIGETDIPENFTFGEAQEAMVNAGYRKDAANKIINILAEEPKPQASVVDRLLPAIRQGDAVYVGKKGQVHADIASENSLLDNPNIDLEKLENGFSLDGRFLTRDEATAIINKDTGLSEYDLHSDYLVALQKPPNVVAEPIEKTAVPEPPPVKEGPAPINAQAVWDRVKIDDIANGRDRGPGTGPEYASYNTLKAAIGKDISFENITVQQAKEALIKYGYKADNADEILSRLVIKVEGKNAELVAASPEVILVKDAAEQKVKPVEEVPAEQKVQPAEEVRAEEAAPEAPKTLDEAYDQINRQIRMPSTKGRREKISFNRLYAQFVDEINPFWVATKRAAKEKGVDLPTFINDPSVLARLAKGTFGKADAFIEFGPFKFNDFSKAIGPGLKEIVEPIKDDYYKFRAYIIAKRAIELNDRGIDGGVPLEAAKKIIKEDGERFEAVHKQLVEYQNALVDYLADSGIISEEAKAAMFDANQDYIPFFRYMDETVNIRQMTGLRKWSTRNPFVEIKGSELQIIDPMESVIKNTYTYIALAEKNRVGIALVEQLNGTSILTRVTNASLDKVTRKILQDQGLEFPGLADMVVEMRKANEPKGETLTIFRNGEKETYLVNDPELLIAWRGLDQTSAGVLTRIFAIPAAGLRLGSTLTPDFIVRNGIRDLFTAFVNSKGIFSPIDTGRGFIARITKNESYQQWLRSGGANAALVSIDQAYIQNTMFRFNKDMGIMDRTWNVVRSPIVAGKLVSELMENATRLGEFIKVKGTAPTQANLIEAAYRSREVTIDFSRMGAKMRAYNMITAFANANIQGLDRTIRAFKNRPVGTTLRIAGGITVPSILLWYANKDDPRWLELPGYIRDLNWVIMTSDWQKVGIEEFNKATPGSRRLNSNGQYEVDKGYMYLIPKPFELGIAFGSSVERVLDAYFKEDPRAFDTFFKQLVSTILPQFSPTGIVPFVEQQFNVNSFTGNPLIPNYLLNQVPELEYQPFTTETTKALARIVNAVPFIRNEAMDPNSVFSGLAHTITSPLLIENWLQDWTGGTGRYALLIADKALRNAGIVPNPPKPEYVPADIPVVRAFVARYPSMNTRSIQEFYDRNKVNSRIAESFKVQASTGNIEEAKRLNDLYGVRITADKIQKALGEIASTIRMISDNPNIGSIEKRQLIDSYYFRMIEFAKYGNQQLDLADKIIEQNKK